MTTQCEWCESHNIEQGIRSVFWELPDGSRAIEISETPTIICRNCQMSYQTETIIQEIEDQLFLVRTNDIQKKIAYPTLMAMPKILKKNYFR